MAGAHQHTLAEGSEREIVLVAEFLLGLYLEGVRIILAAVSARWGYLGLLTEYERAIGVEYLNVDRTVPVAVPVAQIGASVACFSVGASGPHAVIAAVKTVVVSYD